MNVERIKSQVVKAINKTPSTVEIKRNTVNEFNEPDGENSVTTMKGFFYTGSQSLNMNVSTGATITTGKVEKIMVVYDEEGQKIKEHDYFTLKGVKYEIIDIGNLFDVCLDMMLERV